MKVKIVEAKIKRIMWCDTCETAEHDADECQECSRALVEIGWQESATQ